MKRKVYLDGELGAKYGRELTIDAENFAEVFKCLDCNFPGFREYLLECEQEGIGFSMEVGEAPITDEKELIMNFREGDMYISPQPAGAKGVVKIIAAIVIAVLIISNPAGWAIAAGSLTTAGALAAGFAISLAISGLAEMMAPDPATDKSDFSQDTSYLFQGSGQTIQEGDPVPVVYGKLRVPGRLVSFDIRNQKSAFKSGAAGALNLNIDPSLLNTAEIETATSESLGVGGSYAQDLQAPGNIFEIDYSTIVNNPDLVTFKANEVFV